MFEHARPLRADRPRLPAEARGVPPRAVTWGPFHRPAEALTCERAPARSPTPHPSARPRSPAPLSLGAHGARDTAPSALPVDTGQILCLSTGAPHSPRHPAGDPECPPPHPCPQTCVQAYARLSFWKKLWWRGEPTGLGANPGSCTSYWRPAPAAYTLRASVSIREVGMMTGPASWSLLVSGAAKVPQTKWLKVIETCPLPVLEAGSLTSRCGQGDFP